MRQITQYNDTACFGLACRAIYGLNIFAVNRVPTATPDDPRMVFLRSLSQCVACSACVGYLSLKDFVDDPAEIFGPPAGAISYERVPIGLYGGSFYDLTDYPTGQACFFPEVSDVFWNAASADGHYNVLSVLRNDALSLLIGAPQDAEAGASSSLFSSPFLGEESYLQLLTSIYPLVLVSSGDATDFIVYSNDTKNFVLLDEPVAEATRVVETSQWYSDNQYVLVWDDEYAGCLRLPAMDTSTTSTAT